MTKEPLGRYLFYCPKCGTEVTDHGYNRDTNRYEKECLDCELQFTRVKGYGHKWIQGSLWDWK